MLLTATKVSLINSKTQAACLKSDADNTLAKEEYNNLEWAAINFASLHENRLKNNEPGGDVPQSTSRGT
jgi:hypothetical protein